MHLDYQHIKYVMAVEGKLRSLFVNLSSISNERNILMRPFLKVMVENSKVR